MTGDLLATKLRLALVKDKRAAMDLFAVVGVLSLSSRRTQQERFLELPLRTASADFAQVFWGDQIFVPSCGIQKTDYPADILAALRFR